ncbi:MAG: restriction endonuclease subunit S, partial [Verrucomicrobiota bacterium]|nr:restriction endonuclease subunit S [Verrucomicrobiota bacterium]
MSHEPNTLPDGYRMTELGPLPEEWQVVRLGETLKLVPRRQRMVRIAPDALYSLVSTRLYAKGVGVKKEVLGREMKTKTWFRVAAGDFIFLKIWARKGAFGFVPNGIRGTAIVSGDYPILELDRERASQEFVELALSLPHRWKAL